MTLRTTFALGLTSIGLVIACGEAVPPGGTGGAGNLGSGGAVNANSGGSVGISGGNVGNAGGNVGTAGGNVGNAGGHVGNTGGNVGNTGGNVGNTGGDVGNAGGSSAGGTGPEFDEGGKPNVTAGTTVTTAQEYLRLGEIRLLNNNWGSAELMAAGCTAGDSSMSIFVDADRSFGWTFNRGDCDKNDTNAKPDFPQIEFGIHPFGIGNTLATSPDYSSTTLLPLQIKDIDSASVTVDELNIQLGSASSWNITFEFWLSQQHPDTAGNAGVYAELMTFWGWQGGRWPDSGQNPGPIGSGSGVDVTSEGRSYKLWVQDDAWADGKWRYFQFRDNGGPQQTFDGKLDVKPFLDYLVQQRQYSEDLWVTRLEVGSEIDDNTSGTVRMQGITFEVNGQSRSQIILP